MAPDCVPQGWMQCESLLLVPVTDQNWLTCALIKICSRPGCWFLPEVSFYSVFLSTCIVEVVVETWLSLCIELGWGYWGMKSEFMRVIWIQPKLGMPLVTTDPFPIQKWPMAMSSIDASGLTWHSYWHKQTKFKVWFHFAPYSDNMPLRVTANITLLRYKITVDCKSVNNLERCLILHISAIIVSVWTSHSPLPVCQCCTWSNTLFPFFSLFHSLLLSTPYPHHCLRPFQCSRTPICADRELGLGCVCACVCVCVLECCVDSLWRFSMWEKKLRSSLMHHVFLPGPSWFTSVVLMFLDRPGLSW